MNISSSTASNSSPPTLEVTPSVATSKQGEEQQQQHGVATTSNNGKASSGAAAAAAAPTPKSMISEDQKAKARARRSSRVTERRISESSSATNGSVGSTTTANDDIVADAVPAEGGSSVTSTGATTSTTSSRGRRSSKKKSSAAGKPKRNTSSGSVSVLSIDEDDEEEFDEEGDDAVEVVAVPTLLYSKESKGGSSVVTTGSRDDGKSINTEDNAAELAPTELTRNANQIIQPPVQPGAVRIIPTNLLDENGNPPNDFHDSRGSLGKQGIDDVENGGESNTNELVDAELVDQESDRRRIQETLQDVLQTQDAVKVVDLEAEDRLKRSRQRRNLCIYLAIGIILTVVIVVAVVVSVKKSQERLSQQPPTEMPSESPTAAPTSRISAVQMYIEDAFETTIPSIDDDPSSPQARAVKWLTEVDTTTTFPFESEEDEYAFYDRYVVAVFAYSTNYEDWTDNTNWMDGGISSCEWKGLSCNDDGRISVLDLAVNNLSGNIPTEIGFLDNLDFVFLFRNSLEGM